MTLLEELQAQILAESGLDNQSTPITSPIAPGDLRSTQKSSGSTPETTSASAPPAQERASSQR